ncbi:LOW QUALITY PROTEIN: hypothetical protein HID58_056312, partial [Brassica napus]
PSVVDFLTSDQSEFLFYVSRRGHRGGFSIARSDCTTARLVLSVLLLLFADWQGILGCPVVKPLWRLEFLTFVVALAWFVSSCSHFSSSLPTWYVAGFCCFPTACFHTVKLMSLLRLAVAADAELGHLFRLMQLQPPTQGDSGSSLRWLSHFNSSNDECKETHH